MAEALDFFLDDHASAQIVELRARLAIEGVPVSAAAPSVRFARGAAIPSSVRGKLSSELRRLVLPELWLAVLGTILTEQPRLVLGAVTDTELLSTHGEVHDALAGRVRQPSGRYLPGSWLPHCPLTREMEQHELAAALTTLIPVQPIRAKVVSIGITDTRTGTVTPLFG
ncbi:MAG TPA: 2'-5' RNA ligase family protein [Pseudonocardia sp.]|nr:2'-5' RNA ligase family protein [Pseudonocardia sp.]